MVKGKKPPNLIPETRETQQYNTDSVDSSLPGRPFAPPDV